MTDLEQHMLDSFIELEALDQDQFLKLKETLTRIGAPQQAEGGGLPTLWQSAHVFHNRGRYYLVHFKQMFMLDGRLEATNYTESDEDRLWAIAILCKRWGLATPKAALPKARVKVTVIPYAEKNLWNLRAKYSIGKKRKEGTN